jgi:hypothetical protein
MKRKRTIEITVETERVVEIRFRETTTDGTDPDRSRHPSRTHSLTRAVPSPNGETSEPLASASGSPFGLEEP